VALTGEPDGQVGARESRRARDQYFHRSTSAFEEVAVPDDRPSLS
jgi:hypothetical protein